MLPYIICGAVVLGVFAWLSSTQNQARQELQNSQHRLHTRLNSMTHDIKKARQAANDSARFEKYMALYHASIEQSVSQHEGYAACKKLVAMVKQKRDEVGARISELKTLRAQASKKARQMIVDELNTCYAWLNQIKQELTRLHEQKSELLAILRQINQNTHDLKMSIKDKCGRGGRIWYERKFG